MKIITMSFDILSFTQKPSTCLVWVRIGGQFIDQQLMFRFDEDTILLQISLTFSCSHFYGLDRVTGPIKFAALSVCYLLHLVCYLFCPFYFNLSCTF